jgi:5-methylcytosine-specific restriction endonuclease McrA
MDVGYRDGWRCARCLRKVRTYPPGQSGPDAFHCDHIVPWSQGGSDDPSNLQTLCRDCNLRKGNRIRSYVHPSRRGIVR